MKTKQLVFCLAGLLAGGAEAVVLPRPPVIVVPDLRQDEKPIAIESAVSVVAENAAFKRVQTLFTFTNPNSRQMSADFEFPIPDDATVCGYELEIDGAMIPGVVVPKEKARVAFETEKARRVDPGIVEHVKGNIWKTRVFPLEPGKPRKVSVDYIVALESPAICAEKDGEDVFLACPVAPGDEATFPKFEKCTIIWDASSSAEQFASAWRAKIESLPEKGEWQLLLIRNACEKVGVFTQRTELLAALDALVYDGGTDIGEAVASAGDGPILLFTDELDTLGLEEPQYEERAGLFVASRDKAKQRKVEVKKLAKGEALPDGVQAGEGKLLATAWAASRIADLASQAEARAEEFLALGRRYGVASPVTSLIVLETLDQYLTHKIEPPSSLSFHDEWVARRAKMDDEIDYAAADLEHKNALLRLWKERVDWWNNPIPKIETPKSGLFDTVRSAMGGLRRASRSQNGEFMLGAAAPGAVYAARSADMEEAIEDGAVEERSANEQARSAKAAVRDTSKAGGGGAKISIAAWNPSAPYLDAIAKAPDPYKEYIVQKKANGKAPAFFMDVASWFFKKGEKALAVRIISNMAEFKLEDAAIWRSMGWRLREAAAYDEAIRCFRKALKLRTEEGQSRRDLALVLSERAMEAAATNVAADLEEAMKLLKDAAFTNWARRSARRSNDRQVAIISLEELNALIAYCQENKIPAAIPELESAFRRDLPVKIRIVLSWDADETDIDIHVLEPNGEEAFYGHRRTSSGGFVSEDVTSGYGPEEYMRKEAKGTFKILTNYFASHQTALTGATTATATVYTDWATPAQKREIITLRLEKQKDKHMVGEVEVE